MTQNCIFLGPDFMPLKTNDARCQATLKLLTLLHCAVLFDCRKEDLETATALRKADWEELVDRGAWRTLPDELNTLVSPTVYRAVKYGAQSGVKGMTEIDYLVSWALQHATASRAESVIKTSVSFPQVMHAALVWLSTGTGFSTRKAHVFDALSLFVRAAHCCNIETDETDPNRLADQLRVFDEARQVQKTGLRM